MARLPLTKAQQALWIEWRRSPEAGHFNTCVKLKLEGPLDNTRFLEAAATTVTLFDSLHSFFEEEDGIPYQIFEKNPIFQPEFIDVSHEKNAEEKALKLLEEQLLKPIDLLSFPIINAALIKESDDTHYFIGVVPHIISDGVSANFFLEAISICYNQGQEGLLAHLEHKEFSWKNTAENFEGSHSEAAKKHWLERLDDADFLVDFGKETSLDDHKGKRLPIPLTIEESTALRKLASHCKTTPFILVMGLLSVFLYRFFGKKEVVLGYPVDIRPANARHVFGFFINLLPLATTIDATIGFRDFVRLLTKLRKEDRNYQDFPAMDIIRTLRAEDPHFNGRLFNSSVTQTVSRLQPMSIEGVTSTPLLSENLHADEDFVLSFEIEEQGLSLWLEYRQALFSDAQIVQFTASFQSIIRALIHEPDMVIDYIPLVETHSPTLWNQTYKPYEFSSIFQHASLQKNSNLLIQQSEQIASTLVSLGVKKGDKIGVSLPRCNVQIAALLGILRAGAAYVPLDPSMPAERLDYMQENSQCRFILTDKKHQITLPKRWEELTLIVSDMKETGKALPAIAPGDLAYVLFTSGSTGRPKGVMISHESLMTRLQGLQQIIPLTQEDVFLYNTAYSFDVSIPEIFWPLLVGAKQALTSATDYKDPSHVLSVMREQKVTIASFTPTALGTLLSRAKTEEESSLHHCIAIGEVLPPHVKNRFYEIFPNATLWNSYGPTEATIYATFEKCEKDLSLATIPIGTNLNNVTSYVLNPSKQLQPPFANGELYLGGIGIAEGYIGQEELTKERFITNPFDKDAWNKRLYQTGDFVYQDNTGTLHFKGRDDGQVKLRGHRIELSEIEQQLLSHETVEQALVKVIDGKQLVAYVVGNVTEELLRAYLAQKLPSYMVPHWFVMVEAFPLTHNGKIDHKNLPLPQHTLKKEAFVAPKTQAQQLLAKIWAEILKIEQKNISIHDHFFALGGDSLLAISMASKIEKEGFYLSSDALFNHHDIESLAPHITVKTGDNAAAKTLHKHFPYLARHQKFFADGFVNPHHWSRVFLADVEMKLDEKILKKAFAAALAHHDGLRISFSDQHIIQHDINDFALPIAFHTRKKASEADISTIVNQSLADITITKAPLLKLDYIHTGRKKGVLAFIAHHLLLDVMSSRIFFEDLMLAYQQLATKQDISLPPTSATLGAYATAMENYALTHDFGAEKRYWLEHRPSANYQVPTDYEAPLLEGDTQIEVITLSQQDTDTLLNLAPDISMRDSVLGAVSEGFMRWSQQTECLVNIPGHGRAPTLKDTSAHRLIGWVNYVYPLLITRNNNSIKAVQDAYKTLPAEGLSYGLLKYTKADPALKSLKEPEVFFNYVSRVDTELPDHYPITLREVPETIPLSAPENRSCYKLYIEAGILGGTLRVHVGYSQKAYEQATIERLVEEITNAFGNYVDYHDALEALEEKAPEVAFEDIIAEEKIS